MHAFRPFGSRIPGAMFLSGVALMIVAAPAAPMTFAQSAPSGPSQVAPDAADSPLVTVAATQGAAPAAPADPSALRSAYLRALADKLGISQDKLQSAIDAVTQQLGAAPLALGSTPSPPQGADVIVALPDLSEVASMLGISTAQLTQEWARQSLADVAQAHHVSVDAIGAAYKRARLAQLDQAISSGKLATSVAQPIRDHVDQEVQMALGLPRPDPTNLRLPTQ